jgi:hypothetical protein
VSILLDAPDFVSVSTDHSQKPRLMPWNDPVPTPRSSLLSLLPRQRLEKDANAGIVPSDRPVVDASFFAEVRC